jgi:hypothetical protein
MTQRRSRARSVLLRELELSSTDALSEKVSGISTEPPLRGVSLMGMEKVPRQQTYGGGGR